MGFTEDDNKGGRKAGGVGWCIPGGASRPITYGIYGEPGEPVGVMPGCVPGSSVMLFPVWSVWDHSVIRGLPDITDVIGRGLVVGSGPAGHTTAARRLSIGI